MSSGFKAGASLTNFTALQVSGVYSEIVQREFRVEERRVVMCDATIVGHFSFDSPVRQDSLLLQEDNRSRLLSDHVSSEARGTFVVLKVSFAKQGRTFPAGLLKYSFAGEVWGDEQFSVPHSPSAGRIYPHLGLPAEEPTHSPQEETHGLLLHTHLAQRR